MVRKALIAAVGLALLCVPAVAQEKKKDGFTKEELRRYFQQADREYIENQKNIDPDEVHLLFRELHKKKGRAVTDGNGSTDNNQSGSPNIDGADPNRPEGLTDQNPDGTGPNGTPEGKAASGATDSNADPAKGGTTADTKAGKSGAADGQGSAGQGAGPTNGKHSSGKSGAYSRRNRQSDRYVPPSFSAGKARTAGGFAESKSSKKSGPFFGIRRGTKYRVETRQVTTNVESNLMEIYVIQDVYGDYDLMAKETKLYATKSLNSGTNRLEALVTSGITPDGREFKMKGIVLDINKTAGLAGAITTDGKMADRSVSSGAFEVGRSIVSTLNDGSIIGAGVEAAAENALKEKETEVDKGLNRPLYVISVEPQQFIIRVEETY